VRSGKWKHFYGRPWATVNIATPLQQGMRWDITSLVQNVNLICAKKVYYCNRPKYFFLCVNSRITSKIFKTCFGQNEQVWMDEKLVTILLFEIRSSAFCFFKSQNYHLLILNIWRILNQTLVV